MRDEKNVPWRANCEASEDHLRDLRCHLKSLITNIPVFVVNLDISLCARGVQYMKCYIISTYMHTRLEVEHQIKNGLSDCSMQMISYYH